MKNITSTQILEWCKDFLETDSVVKRKVIYGRLMNAVGDVLLARRRLGGDYLPAFDFKQKGGFTFWISEDSITSVGLKYREDPNFDRDKKANKIEVNGLLDNIALTKLLKEYVHLDWFDDHFTEYQIDASEKYLEYKRAVAMYLDRKQSMKSDFRSVQWEWKGVDNRFHSALPSPDEIEQWDVNDEPMRRKFPSQERFLKDVQQREDKG